MKRRNRSAKLRSSLPSSEVFPRPATRIPSLLFNDPAIMARRARKGSVILSRNTPSLWNRSALLHWDNSEVVTWSFVVVLSLLCCGFCGAETEFSIMDEAQVLAVQIKKLSTQELGVFTMQVITILF